jgi:hypothetical protein
MNASFHRNIPSSNDKKFRTFCTDLQLQPYDLTDDRPTYHHFMNSITSRIDHIVTPTDNSDILINTYIDHRHPLNTSSHDPLMADISVKTLSEARKSMEAAKCARRKPNWKKIDIPQYQQHPSGITTVP